MMEGAIFDMDGTLLDSMSIWETLGRDYLAVHGIVAPPGLRDMLRPLSLMQTAYCFREQFGLPDEEGDIIDEITGMIECHYTGRVPLKPHVEPYLRQLKSAGVKMCVATATERVLALAALRRTGILGYFDFVITCSEADCGKDSTAFFHRTLARLGTDIHSTVVFEDALYAVKTAKEAGLTVVGVYDASAAPDAAEIRHTADRYIQGFEELIT